MTEGRAGPASQPEGRPDRPPIAWVGVCLGIILGALCLWLAVRQVPLRDLGTILSRARYAWLFPAVLLHLLAIWVRAARWEALLGAHGILVDAFWAQGVGFLFTNALPLRMGEPARVSTLAAQARLPLMRVAASAVVERALDVATILMLLLVVFPFMGVPRLVAQSALAFGILLTAGLSVLLLGRRRHKEIERVVQRLLARVGVSPVGVSRRWQETLDGLRSLGSLRTALQAAAWSIGIWALYVGYYWCTLLAFRLDARPLEAVFMVVALALAISVPSSPGFIGVYQLAGQQALHLPFGDRYDPGTALAVTLVSHLVYFLLTSALGAVGLARSGKTFAELARTIVRHAARSKGTETAVQGPLGG